MRYASFRIENFKGIHKLTFELTSPPTSHVYTLVGLNESGKTTVLEAVNSFTYGSEDLEALQLHGYARPDPHDLIPIAERADFNGSVTITARVLLDDADEEALRTFLRKEHQFALTSCSRDVSVSDVYPFVNSRHDPKTKQRVWSITLQGKAPGLRVAREIRAKDPIWHAAINFLQLGCRAFGTSPRSC